jgi:malto-oligosyltrehalose trehalohydrolase
MPFGAECLDDARVRFRLWAPAAREVALAPGGSAQCIPMQAAADGWWELVAEARAGTCYRFRIDDGLEVPDPASRCNPDGVHGPSEVIDPAAYVWGDAGWSGRPWHEAVVYELHVGAFSPSGTFLGALAQLPRLADLGVTAIELMPVAAFAGARNWGYDGVLPYAPHCGYGRPEDLKRLVDEAHRLGLMVLLDVVYNHFGPEGNYLHAYAPQFFTSRHRTPWGDAINFDGVGSDVVRRFFIHNALYWLDEFHVDGLRLDAVHAIEDDSRPDILTELAEAARRRPGRARHVHLVLENDRNEARHLERAAGGPRAYDAQWNDDFHHALHVLLTGERDGYYADYAERPAWLLGRALAEGYAYQGEHSPFRGRARGTRSAGLPPPAFINFLQNHDQVGNRACGERLPALASGDALRAGLALLLLAPSIPLLFMGEETGSTQPFPFFCDFGGDLARAVTDGRRDEFAHFARFADPGAREAIPDPNAAATFELARIDWSAASQPRRRAWQAYVKHLLVLRRGTIVPLIPDIMSASGRFEAEGRAVFHAQWRCAAGTALAVLANLSHSAADSRHAVRGRVIHAQPPEAVEAARQRRLPPWSVVWMTAVSPP